MITPTRMNSTNAITALRIAACVGAFVAIFRHPLQLPEWTELAGAVVFFVCGFAVWRLQSKRTRTKSELLSGDVRRHTAKIQALRVAMIVTVVAFSSPFWLPYTGITLGAAQLWISVIIGWILAIGTIAIRVFAISKRTASSEPRIKQDRVEP